MARAMWRGAIQFGLITIPLKLYLATEAKGISFNMLHGACGTRIQMKTWCPNEDIAIPRTDTVKGYEYAKGQYVTITDQDLEAVPLKTVRSIEIQQFVPAVEAAQATRFVKQAYYIEPDAVARRAFYLLKAVLAEEGLVAICKIVLKDREQLAALDPYGPTMLLTTLYWPDEIRDTGELDLPESTVDVKPAERAMAKQLVSAMTGEFEPEEYRDDYRDALMSVIEAKIGGVEPAEPAPEAPSANVVDLMAALEASLAAAKAAKAEAPVAAADGTARRRKAADTAQPEAPVEAAAGRNGHARDEAIAELPKKAASARRSRARADEEAEEAAATPKVARRKSA